MSSYSIQPSSNRYDDLLLELDRTKKQVDEYKNKLNRHIESTKMLEKFTQTGQWTWNKNENSINWSDETFHLFEIPISEQAPNFEQYLSLIHPDDVEAVKTSVFEDGMKTGKFTHKYKLKNNPKKVLEGFGSVDFTDDGNVIMYGIVKDITEYVWLYDVLEKNTEFTIYRADPETKIIDYVSNNITNMLGFEKKDIIGTHSYCNLMTDIEQLEESIDKFSKDSTQYFKKYIQRKNKNGDLIDIEALSIATFPSHVWMERDYSKEKQIQYQLDEKLKVLSKMPQNMAYIFEKYGSNPEDCQFLYVSEASNTIYDLDPSIICSNPMSIISLIVPENVESFIHSVNHSYNELDVWKWCGNIVVNNRIKHIQCKAYPELVEVLENGEKLVRWYGSVTDVSETSNSLNEYQQLVENANAPIVGVDTNLNINDWNAKIEQLTGYTKSQVMGTSIMELILPDNKVEVEEILRKALSGDETSNYQLPFKTITNDMIDLLINSSSRRDVNGNIMGVIGIGQDLTQLKKEIVNKNNVDMELELHHKVVAGVFHEVRNPLNVTHQIFELLKTKLMEMITFSPLKDTLPNGVKRQSSSKDMMNYLNQLPKEVFDRIQINIQEDINYMVSNCTEMLEDVKVGIQCSEQKLKVLNGIMSMTQLEQKKLVLKKEEIQLYKLCDSQINMISKTVQTGVITKLNCPEIKILSDDKHLSQILTNLLSNSGKIVENGSITLEIDIVEETTDEYYLNFKVIDSGCGMTQDKIDQLLLAKRFENGGFKHGSGIGLCIVIEILKLMNTKLEITSPYSNGTTNNGCCFSFKYRCPKIITPLTKDMSTTNLNDLKPIENVKILIVDDDKLNHRVLTKQLQNKLKTLFINPPNVSSVYSGEECLEYLKTNKVDVIVMDQIMKPGGLTGSDTVIKIREQDIDTVIIHSSGNCTKEDDIKYYASGSNYVWGKPVPFKEIEINIYHLLGNPQYYIQQNK